MKKLALIATLAAASALTPAVSAQDSYISVFGGYTSKSTSENIGALTSDFTTGTGTTIPLGTPLPSGTALSWNTMFKDGYNISLAYGMGFDNGLRGELEVKYLTNSISSHDSVTAASIDLSNEDAGVLISGSAALGAPVSAIVADGQGKSTTWAFMANAYYDFDASETVKPYIGIGFGYADVKNEFMPSGVAVADSGSGGFAYQGIIGSSFLLDEGWSLIADYRYFATNKAETELSLLPGYLDVENTVHSFNVGFRYSF